MYIYTLNMDENYLLVVYNHHAFRHGVKLFPYVNFYNKSFVLDWIHQVAKTKHKKIRKE